MPIYQFENNAETTVATQLLVAGTTLTVTDASAFPASASADNPFIVTLTNNAGTLIEIVLCTAVSVSDFTIARAQEGTTALQWEVGDVVEMRVTQTHLDQWPQGFDNGGNTRGSDSVTLQAGRTSAAMVASGVGAVAVGNDTQADANYATALGFSADAGGVNATAVGSGSDASGSAAVAAGYLASASSGIAVGESASCSSSGNAAVGPNATASASAAIAVGSATASANNSVAIGSSAAASDIHAVAIGDTAAASQDYAFAQGYQAVASGIRSTAVGYLATASATGAQTYGWAGSASAQDALALGSLAYATAQGGVALGPSSYNETVYGLTLGVCPVMGVERGLDAARQVGVETILAGPPVGLATPATWAATTAYGRGSIVIPIIPNGYHYAAVPDDGVASMTSGGTEPATWGTTPGGTTADGDGYWLCVDPSDMQLDLPANTRFAIEEVGVMILSANTVTVQPQVSFGIDTSTTDVKAAGLTTGLTSNNNIWWAGSPTIDTMAAASLHGAVTNLATATALSGRLLFKGFLMRDF